MNRCNKKPIAGNMTLHLTNQRANCDFEQANCDFERANCDFWNITFAIAGEKGTTDRSLPRYVKVKYDTYFHYKS